MYIVATRSNVYLYGRKSSKATIYYYAYTSTTTTSSRLASLDILRGADLFFLVCLQPVVISLAQYTDWAWLDAHSPATTRPLGGDTHMGYGHATLLIYGWRLYALCPISTLGEPPRREAYIKVSERLLVLYILGMIVQGNLLGLDLTHLYLYSNTLQAIAVGYAISALLLLHCPIRWQIITTASLLVIYALPMILTGDITPEGNFAELVDRAVLGLLWSLWLPIVKCLWTSSMALIYGRVVFRTASPHLLYSGLQGM